MAHYFDYNGMQIAYAVMGEGPNLVILHGWGTNSGVMAYMGRKLSSNHTCYILDLPGFGMSDEPEVAWSVSDYADMVETFIKELGLSPVDILGHSFGGRIILKLAPRDKERKLLNKVIITGGAGMKPKRGIKFYLRKYTAKLLKLPATLLPGTLRDKFLDSLRSTRLWQKLGSSEYAQLQGVMRETFVKTVTEYLESELPRVPHQVLLIWGDEDEATPLYQGRRMEKGLPNATLTVIEGGGHYAFLDKPAKFNIIAEDFLVYKDRVAES